MKSKNVLIIIFVSLVILLFIGGGVYLRSVKRHKTIVQKKGEEVREHIHDEAEEHDEHLHNDHGDEHLHDESEAHDDHDHDRHDQQNSSKVTVWDDRFEIFMEHPFVIANSPTGFVTHITDRVLLQPLRKEPVTFVLTNQSGVSTNVKGSFLRG